MPWVAMSVDKNAFHHLKFNNKIPSKTEKGFNITVEHKAVKSYYYCY